MKKILTIIGIVALIAMFVLFNTVLGGFDGTYTVHGEHEWTSITYKVLEGDADACIIDLKGPHTIHIRYKGDYDFKAEVKLMDVKGRTDKYMLTLSEGYDTINDQGEVIMDFTEIEE